MSSNYILTVKSEEGYPTDTLLMNAEDTACYHDLIVSLKPWEGTEYPLAPGAYSEDVAILPPQREPLRNLPGSIGGDLESIYRKVKIGAYNVHPNDWLCRVYFKDNYFGPDVRDCNHLCRGANPLPLTDEDIVVNSYVNPRYVGRMFKDTLRSIPAFQGVIGPSDGDLYVDVLFDTADLRSSVVLLWLLRRLDEAVNGYVQPNFVTTARALLSISPGLAFTYLLLLESCWLQLLVKGIGNSRKANTVVPWVANVNIPSLHVSPSGSRYASHSLNSFCPVIRKGSTSIPTLRVIKAMTKGKFPSFVGKKELGGAGVTGCGPITDLLYAPCLKESHYKYQKGFPLTVQLALRPEQLEPAVMEIHSEGRVVSPDINEQLDKVVQFMFRRPINYFVKGWSPNEYSA